jgi:hypothetical protein
MKRRTAVTVETAGTSQSRIDLAGSWRLVLGLLVQRPIVALSLVPAIVLVAYAVDKAPILFPGIALSPRLSMPHYHLIVIAREAAVSLIAGSFALPLLAAGGFVPDRNRRRSWSSFTGRAIVAVSITIGGAEIVVSPQDLGNAALGLLYDTVVSPLYLLFDLPALIALHAGLAAVTLVGVPDALWARQRKRPSEEGPHLFLLCLLPFGIAVLAEVAVFLLVPIKVLLPSFLAMVSAFDAAAIFFAVLLAFANHRRYAPDAMSAETAAVFD